MCVGFPGKVIEVRDNIAIVEIFNVRREVDAILFKDLKPGDYVIVHAGLIIAKIDEKEYEETVKAFEEIMGVMQ